MSGDETTSLDSYYDVVIIGAGISGINAAYRLQTQIPNYTYTILEARSSLGGTWDVFSYPGIRSDSDLHTFGFPWEPWTKDNHIADGASIKNYMSEAATKHGIDVHIRYGKRVGSFDWSGNQQLWKVSVDAEGEKETYFGRFVVAGTGYYDYSNPFPAVIPGIENFTGRVVHPQFWPSDLDYGNKKVVIIGSGATAVTLLPKLAEKASLVTMLQRSPSYIASRPTSDPMVSFAKRWLPSRLAFQFARWKYLLSGYLVIRWCRAYPQAARRVLKQFTTKQLPSTIPHDPHFSPSYNPWEQRLCLCPDGDFFEALRNGKGDVVTGKIETMTGSKIVLEDGREIDADIIATATGLKVEVLGGVGLRVDGVPVSLNKKFVWNGTMLQDVPNMFIMIGYTDASWTPGADATSQLVCRLLKHMRRKGMGSATPTLLEGEERKMRKEPLLNVSSTYVRAAADVLPMSSDRAPWRTKKNYFVDMWNAVVGDMERGMVFKMAVASGLRV